MAIASTKTICAACQKEKITYPCEGCSQRFCLDDLPQHRNNLSQQLDHIENDHDKLRQDLNEQKFNSTKGLFIKQIDQWEKDSICQIRQTADQCRDKFINYSDRFLFKTEKRLNDLAQQIKEMRHGNEFNEIDLNQLIERLQKIQEEFLQPLNLSIKEQPTSFINKMSVLIQLEKGMNHSSFI